MEGHPAGGCVPPKPDTQNRVHMKPVKTVTCAVGALALVLGATACAGSAGATGGGTSTTQGGTVTIGESTTLSGPVAELGQSGLQGVQLAVSQLNSQGGLLGKKIKVVSADDAVTPATGASNARSMILNSHVAALFGPVSSAVAVAEEQVAAQQHTLVFFHTSNDSSLMTSHFTKYAFQIVPNTVMEPRAVADYLASKYGKKKITIGTLAPNYSFGTDTVASFLQALKDLHVNFTLVKQEWPPLGAADLTPYLAALVAAHPQYVFNAQYGGDLVAFTKQAESYGFFNHTKVIAMYDYAALAALGSAAPAGAIGFDRAPFWAISSPQMTSFVQQFHAKYGQYPSEWAVLGYAAVQEWAYGVKKAGSFSADKVAAALPGASVPTAIGTVTIRACDHQAEIPEYVGVVSGQASSQYPGVRLWDSGAYVPPFSQIDMSCGQAQALQP